jgi:hypothetical protein
MSTFSGLLSGTGGAFGSLAAAKAGTKTVAKKAAPAKKAAGKKAAAPKAEKKVRVIGGRVNSRLDDSHAPFKRSDKRPGGPAKRETSETKQWSCDWKEPYTQVCTFVGEPGQGPKPGSKKTIKTKAAKKKAYNKTYRDHLKALGKPKFKNEPQGGYKYRKSAWAEERAKKAAKKPAAKKPAAKKAAPKKAAPKKAAPKKSTAKKTAKA